MKMLRFGIALTVVNLVLLVILLAEIYPLAAQSPAPLLRGSGLQIVDAQGRIRAEILLHGPERVGGKLYPETVLFRMADQQKAPRVKLSVSEEGSALGLSDDGNGVVDLHANRAGTYVNVTGKNGPEQVVRREGVDLDTKFAANLVATFPPAIETSDRRSSCLAQEKTAGI